MSATPVAHRVPQDPRARTSVVDGLAVAALLAVPALLATSRDLDTFDGPVLALAAMVRGIAQPPGESLHTLLGWLVTRVVRGYVGVALVSTIPYCLLGIPCLILIDQQVGRPTLSRRARLARALVVAAALAWPSVFHTGTRVEVYTLACAGQLSAFAAISTGRPLLAGLLLGLTACVNPVFALTAALAVAAVIAVRRAFRSLPRVVGGGLLGLLPLLHLPLDARSAYRFAWGAPADLRHLVRVLTAARYHVNLDPSGIRLWDGLVRMAPVVAPALIALGLGLAGIRWRHGAREEDPRGRAAFFAGVAAMGLPHVAWVLSAPPLPHNPDLSAYLVPALVLGGTSLGCLVARTAEAAPGQLVAWLGVLLVVIFGLDVRWIGAHLRHGSPVRRIARAVLDESPPRSLLVLDADSLVFPLLYLQEIEGARPDLVLVVLGFDASRWYWDHLRARHPGLVMPPDRPLTRAGRLQAFVAANPDRPVLAETDELLTLLGLRSCEGTFLMHVRDACPPVDGRRRLGILAAAGREAQGDWMRETTVFSEAERLAVASRARGSLGLAAATLAASTPDYEPLSRTVPLAWQGPPLPLGPRLPDLLVPPEWIPYALGRTLLAMGDRRGLPLIRTAADEGEATARAWQSRTPR